MRKSLFVLVAAMTVAMAVPAFAELQNVQVGGEIRIRGNWYSDSFTTTFGPFVVLDSDNPDALFFEQRTKVNVKADFTDDVTAFIELDSYNLFGDDFRGLDESFDAYSSRGVSSSFGSSILTNVDNSNGTPVSMYQAYIEMREAWGYPLTFRIGRSEMQHGSEFLVGNNDTSSIFRGLSFDGVWGTYANDQVSVTAFWTRLATNNNPARWEHSGDVDFTGIYASYTGIEDMSIDGYYYYYRQAITDPFPFLVDEYQFHTIGARFAGAKAGFDWDLNAAYQTGDSGIASPFDEVSAFGVQGNLGYTFDIEVQPRVFIQGAYFDGDDQDLPFNRLFSDHEYSEFLDDTSLTNIWFIGGGASAQVTESINVSGVVNYYRLVEDFGAPADEDIGIELAIYATYNYSEDLYFSAGYAHLFAGDALDPTTGGIFVTALSSTGFIGDEDVDYVFLETGIKF
jgi:hypothetical protein